MFWFLFSTASIYSITIAEAGADGNYNVYVQHVETYWSHSLKKLSFTLDEAYEDVLGRAKHLLGKPTECFYTSEKLSRIRSSAVLATKNRVIAARLKYKLKEQPGVLGKKQRYICYLK